MKTIISLTTFPPRIHTVHNVIKTLLNQSVPADLVVLYLAEGEFPNRMLPGTLMELLQNPHFEIRWSDENIGPFKKLIYALTDFPEDNIITADDDILYPRDWVSQLLKTQKKYPGTISVHRTHRINIEDDTIKGYGSWTLSQKRGLFSRRIKPSYSNMFGGGAGALFPPHSLHPDVFNKKLFLKMCSHQDDIWFWAMAVLNDKKISVTKRGYDFNKRVIKEVQAVGLWNRINNSLISPNNIAMGNIVSYYPDIARKLGLIVYDDIDDK